MCNLQPQFVINRFPANIERDIEENSDSLFAQAENRESNDLELFDSDETSETRL